MDDTQSFTERVAALRVDGRLGVFAVVLAVALALVGYAAGSVVAGEPPADQLWFVPVVGLCVVLVAALAAAD